MLTQEYEAWTHSERMEHSNPSPPLLHGSEGYRRACDANDTRDLSVKGLPVKKPETWGSCSQDPELGSWLPSGLITLSGLAQALLLHGTAARSYLGAS